MTISALEARDTTQFLIDNITENGIITNIDDSIEKAIYAGEFGVTVTLSDPKLKKIIIKYYKDYGYNVLDYGENAIHLVWDKEDDET